MSYKPRSTFWTYQAYLKNRASSCYYNKGLYLSDASGNALDRLQAYTEFQKALCADKYNEDAKYQLNLLLSHDISGNCLLDCSGCCHINNTTT